MRFNINRENKQLILHNPMSTSAELKKLIT